MTIKGNIKLNNNTKNHAASLTKLGYEVESAGDHIVVHGSEVLKTLDLSEDPAGALLQVIENRQLLSYGTRVKMVVGDEIKEYSSVPMCLKLGGLCKAIGIPHNLSCLVVQPEGKGKAAKTAVEVDPRFAQFK